MGEVCIIKWITLTKLLFLSWESQKNRFVVNIAAAESGGPLKAAF